MKYIVYEQGAVIHCVIFADHTSHSQIICEEAKPVSAGFFYIKEDEVITYGKSESLNLTPKSSDSGLIEAVLLNLGIYAFMKV